MPGMNRYLPAALCAAACLLTAACTSNSTDQTPAIASTASCETALVHQLQSAEANPNGPSGTKPAACYGLSDATLNTLAQQAMASVFAGMASWTALPTALPTDLGLPSDIPSTGAYYVPTDLPTP